VYDTLGDTPTSVLVLIPLEVALGDELDYPTLGESQDLGGLCRCVSIFFHAGYRTRPGLCRPGLRFVVRVLRFAGRAAILS
jgi:hypothetical protein